MPTTPNVQFQFENKNVQNATPLLGVSHVIARTVKGPFNSPDEVINSYPAFQEIYGEEIVPDGSISNIKKALELGSKLRISRVEGGKGAEKGTAKSYTPGGEPVIGGSAQTIKFTLIDPSNKSNTIVMVVSIQIKEPGSPVLDNTGYGLDRNFYLMLTTGTHSDLFGKTKR